MKSLQSITKLCIALTLTVLVIASCKKDTLEINQTYNNDNYSGMNDFFKTNGVKSEFFSFDASVGGTFTSAKGTKITIQPNSFEDKNYNTVTGTASLEFKDIYSKSDMVLTNMPTTLLSGGILKSAGMFYIRVKQDNQALSLVYNKKIIVEQPLNGFPIDTNMVPFRFQAQDSNGTQSPAGWVPSTNDTLNGVALDTIKFSAAGYIYSVYNFGGYNSDSIWCNTDNPLFFSSYSQTTLTVHQTDDPKPYGTNVFLLFQDINAVVSLYSTSNNNYIYNYAPIGLKCVIVALGVKNGKLVYDMKEITISPNLTVNVTLSEIKTEALIKKLKTLNN